MTFNFRCFVIYYGTEFNLKSLSCVTFYADDCPLWCNGIQFLLEDIGRASHRYDQMTSS